MNSRPIFCDSSIAFYAAGCIGYRWAVKVMNAFAVRKVRGHADSFLFLEVVNQYVQNGDYEGAHLMWKMLRRVFPVPTPVTVEDFEAAALMQTKFPEASPRVLSRSAVMKRAGAVEIAATFSSGMEKVSDIQRINLMARLDT